MYLNKLETDKKFLHILKIDISLCKKHCRNLLGKHMACLNMRQVTDSVTNKSLCNY